MANPLKIMTSTQNFAAWYQLGLACYSLTYCLFLLHMFLRGKAKKMISPTPHSHNKLSADTAGVGRIMFPSGWNSGCSICDDCSRFSWMTTGFPPSFPCLLITGLCMFQGCIVYSYRSESLTVWSLILASSSCAHTSLTVCQEIFRSSPSARIWKALAVYSQQLSPSACLSLCLSACLAICLSIHLHSACVFFLSFFCFLTGKAHPFIMSFLLYTHTHTHMHHSMPDCYRSWPMPMMDAI